MSQLLLYLTFIIVLFNFSVVVEAKSVCSEMPLLCENDFYADISSDDGQENIKYRLAALPALIENHFIHALDLDTELSVPGLIGDRLYATGDIYIDSDYFFNHVAEGLVFDQEGSVYFEPSLPADWSMPDFSSWDFGGGIGFSGDDFSIDYLINGDLVDVVRSFHSLGNIYIVDSGYPSAVPLPGAAWFFATAIVGLTSLRRAASR